MKRIFIIAMLFAFLTGCSASSTRVKNNSDDKKIINTLYLEQQSQNAYIPSSPSKDKFFINPNIGWKATYNFVGMFTEEMVLFKTNNGGKSWTEVANSKDKSSTLPGGDKIGMSFISSTKGWLTSDTPWEGRVDLYKTEDGGITWVEQRVNVPTELQNCDIYSFPPLFLSASDGILLAFGTSGNGERNFLFYITHDSGESWISFTNNREGTSGDIKWNFKGGTPENYEVNYQKSTWIFENDTWVQK